VGVVLEFLEFLEPLCVAFLAFVAFVAFVENQQRCRRLDLLALAFQYEAFCEIRIYYPVEI
jgi:hypothetical protein